MTSAYADDLPAVAWRSVSSIAVKGGQSALAFLAALAAAGWLGAAAYGDYVVALSVLNIAVAVGAFGLPQLLLRHVSVYEQKEAWGLRRGLRRRSLQLAGGVAAVTAAAGAGLMMAADSDLLPFADPRPVAVALCLVGPLVLLRVLGAWLLARQRIVAGQLGESLLRHAFFLGLMAVAVLLGLQADGLTAMLLQAAAVIIALGVMVALCARDERGLPGPVPAFQTRAWMLAAVPLMATGLLHVALYNVDVLMLGGLRDAAAAGVYHAAARIAQLAALAQVAVNVVLGPAFARLYAAGETAQLQHIVVSVARALTLLAVIFLLVLAFIGPKLLALLGPGFEAGHVVLVILLAAQAVNVAAGAVGLLLDMAGMERVTLAGVAAGAAANIVLNAVLIPPFGVTGAAIATGGSMVLWNVLLCVAVIRRLGINPTAFARLGRVR